MTPLTPLAALGAAALVIAGLGSVAGAQSAAAGHQGPMYDARRR